MKSLKFRNILVGPILKREKTSTWRLFDDKDIQKGDNLEYVSWEKGEVFAQGKVLSVVENKFVDLTKADQPGHEKFTSDQEMYGTYAAYYKKPVDKDSMVKIIKFQFI